MAKTLTLLAAFLPFGALIAGSPAASAMSITQKSDQSVNGGYVTTCVDVKGSHIDNGTPVGPYPCNDDLNEEWILETGLLHGIGTSNDVYKCVSTQNSSVGAPVVMESCSRTDQNQVWMVTNTGEIMTANGRCLDSKGYVGAHGQLVVSACTGVASQIWKLK